MNRVLCVTFVAVVAAVAHVQAAAVAQKPQEERYTTKYNNFDVDSVLNNTKILKSYVKCVLGEGSCTPEGRELAKIVPDAIKTECSKCDEKQKSTSIKVMKHLNRHHPDLLEKLMKKFDPKGEHEKKLRDQIRKAEAAAPAAPSSSSSSSPAPTQAPTTTKTESSSSGSTANKPVTKLEPAKIESKPSPAAAAVAAAAPSKTTETKIDSSKPASAAPTKPQPTKLEATRPAAAVAAAAVAKPKPATETKKPAEPHHH